MSDITTAFWGMTINNYDETDLALVQNGYPDHMRELVYTLEEGKEGTPHIQAYLKLKRQQRLSFVKRLFPRGHFKALTNATYVENTKRYAQKLDSTARSAAVHKFNDPIHTIEGLVRLVINKMMDDCPDVDDLEDARKFVERWLVREDYTMAKIFVSATYKQMWKQFGHDMYQDIFHQRQSKLLEEELSRRKSLEDTHTHTHTREEFSRRGGITSDAEDESCEDGQEDSGQEPGEDDEDYDEGSDSETEASTESDDSGRSESDAESQD
jgi:hypothetical protein